jgi:hypothetical protein
MPAPVAPLAAILPWLRILPSLPFRSTPDDWPRIRPVAAFVTATVGLPARVLI